MDAGISWGANLWLGLVGGAALLAVAVALWIRLPRAPRVAAAMTIATVAAAVNVIAVIDSRVSDAFSDLVSAL